MDSDSEFNDRSRGRMEESRRNKRREEEKRREEKSRIQFQIPMEFSNSPAGILTLGAKDPHMSS